LRVCRSGVSGGGNGNLHIPLAAVLHPAHLYRLSQGVPPGHELRCLAAWLPNAKSATHGPIISWTASIHLRPETHSRLLMMQPGITGSRVHIQCAFWSCMKRCNHVSAKLQKANQICGCRVLHTNLGCWLPFAMCLSGAFTALYSMPTTLCHGPLQHACWAHCLPFAPCQLGALTAVCTVPIGSLDYPFTLAERGVHMARLVQREPE